MPRSHFPSLRCLLSHLHKPKSKSNSQKPQEQGSKMADPMRILCFGDSLTAGYHTYGMNYAPYATAFKQRMHEALGDWGVDVVVEGMSGDRVFQGGFRGRMERMYMEENNRKPLYDWVFLLGGTNDLGYGKNVVDIYDALVEVSEIPLSQGAKLLFMTVPECSAKSETLDAKRNDLNELIKTDTRDDVYLFDLHKLIPYHKMKPSEREDIWDDGLHFTSAGYARMGELVADRLIEILGSDSWEGKVSGSS